MPTRTVPTRTGRTRSGPTPTGSMRAEPSRAAIGIIRPCIGAACWVWPSAPSEWCSATSGPARCTRVVFGGLEVTFFAANLSKVAHGGWLPLPIASWWYGLAAGPPDDHRPPDRSRGTTPGFSSKSAGAVRFPGLPGQRSSRTRANRRRRWPAVEHPVQPDPARACRHRVCAVGERPAHPARRAVGGGRIRLFRRRHRASRHSGRLPGRPGQPGGFCGIRAGSPASWSSTGRRLLMPIPDRHRTG